MSFKDPDPQYEDLDDSIDSFIKQMFYNIRAHMVGKNKVRPLRVYTDIDSQNHSTILLKSYIDGVLWDFRTVLKEVTHYSTKEFHPVKFLINEADNEVIIEHPV